MKKTLFVVAAASVAFTCLGWAQPPQGAKETVVIQGEKPAATPKETLPAPGSAPKPQVNRDPFAKGMAAPPPPPPTLTQKPGPKPPAAAPGSNDGASNGEANLTDKPAEPEVAAPQVEVTGMLLSPKGNMAILKGPKRTYIVKAGDKLGDYRVAAIDKKTVTFKFKDKKFPLKLTPEFGGEPGN